MSETNQSNDILVVCTGNICRSPAAEALLSEQLAETRLSVGSAGTGALVGHDLDEAVRARLRAIGVDAGRHSARQVVPTMLRGATLILVATREHRSRLVSQVPATVRRTFTIKEFARLAHRIDTSRISESRNMQPSDQEVLQELVSQAGRLRHPAEQREDDIVDPYHAGAAIHDTAFKEIESSCRQISAQIVMACAAANRWKP